MTEDHPSELDLICYFTRDMRGVEESRPWRIADHVAHCVLCQEKRDFILVLESGAKELTEEEFTSDEPCPSAWVMANFVFHLLKEGDARSVRAHMLHCDECFEEYVALTGQEEISRDTLREVSHTESLGAETLEEKKKIVGKKL